MLCVSSYNWQSANYDAVDFFVTFQQVHFGCYVSHCLVLWPSGIPLCPFHVMQLTAMYLNISLTRATPESPARGCHAQCTKCLAKKRCLWRNLKFNKYDTLPRSKYRDCLSLAFSHQAATNAIEERLIERNSLGSSYRFVNK